MDKSLPKVSAIQMCSSDKIEENFNMAEKLIREAKQQGSTLAVLPEMFGTFTEKKKIGESFGEGPIQNFLSHQAKQNKIWIVGGTIPISCSNHNKFRAACLIYNDQGKLISRYDKINLFDVTVSSTEFYKESDAIQPGEEIITVTTPVGKIGLAICYDLRFPELFKTLNKQGAEIIILPSAFTFKTGQAHWEILTRSRAIENFSYFIGANQGGTHSNGRQTYGHSLIIDPWGEVKAKLEEGVGVITSEIDLSYLKEVRRKFNIN
jgi:predicted amidohydrolase